MADVAYGKTQIRQLIFDLGCTDLSPKYLARKHRKPIDEILRVREKVRKAMSRLLQKR